MAQEIKLSGQQHKIMRALWDTGEMTVKQVCEALSGDLAHTTVGTMLTRLEKKGAVASSLRGRERCYRPAVSEGVVRRSMVANLVSSVFEDNPRALLAHLLHDSDIEEGDLEEMKALLEKEAK